MVSELQAETNALVRLFDRYGRESVFIVLVAVCVIVTIGAYLKADRAIDAANAASAMATTWQQMYKETERECRLAQNDVQGLQMDLVEAGIPQTHGKKQ